MSDTPSDVALKRLQQVLSMQHFYIAQYAQPSESKAYETLRTLDDLFCGDLMEPDRHVTEAERKFRKLASWGVDHALS
jgi:hypothetical protein